MAIPITINLRNTLGSGFPENLLLRFTKYNSVWDDNWSIPKDKSVEFNRLVNFNVPKMDLLICNYNAQLNELIEGLKRSGFFVECVVLKSVSRLAIGMGEQNVLENSLKLHHIFGFPYIPGSAVKGVTRAFAEMNSADNRKEIFGSENKSDRETIQGKVFFFDAIPETSPKLEVDILTPHYSDYYQKTAVPGDWMTPSPVSFLTVGKGARMTFFVASRNKKLCQEAFGLMKEALCTLGAGAKTAIGLGLFYEAPKLMSREDYFIKINSAKELKPDTDIQAKVIEVDGFKCKVQVFDNRNANLFEIPNFNEFSLGQLITVRIKSVKSNIIKTVERSRNCVDSPNEKDMIIK